MNAVARTVRLSPSLFVSPVDFSRLVLASRLDYADEDTSWHFATGLQSLDSTRCPCALNKCENSTRTASIARVAALLTLIPREASFLRLRDVALTVHLYPLLLLSLSDVL